MDSELTRKEHVAIITAACFYHIRRMRQVRRRIGQEVTQQLVLALIMSRLDYCNSVLAGLPTSTIQPLQRVQNAAARLVFGLSRSDHVTPTLIQLHWLQASYSIKFKLCCLVHAIHYGRSPAYLTETVQSVGDSRSRFGLCSSSTSSMNLTGSATVRMWSGRAFQVAGPACENARSPNFVRSSGTKFGERAFSHAGPATWNALPDHVRTVADPVKFRKLLIPHYFSQGFNKFC